MSKKAMLVMRYFLVDESAKINNKYHPKFDDQIIAVNNLGYECTYFGINEDGIFRICNGKRQRLGKVWFKNIPIIHRFGEYAALYRYTRKESENDYDFIYVRSCPMVLGYAKAMREYSKNCKKIIVEIPTYPVEKEIKNSKQLWMKLFYPFMKYVERKASKYVGLYSLIGDSADEYLGRPAINIINGTNPDGYAKHLPRTPDGTIHIIAMAGMAHYHGFDRLITGLKNYYENGNNIPVYIHMVGPDADGSREKWRKLSLDLGISKYVLFEGEKTGQAMDDMFAACDVAVGSLAAFRKGLHVEFDLKTAEYCSRGIPLVVCSPYIKNELNIPHCYSDIPETEEPVDIKDVVNFALDEIKKDSVADELREYVKRFSWEAQFQKMLKYFDN